MHRKTDWSENRKDDKGEMSFSGMVKEELSRQIGLARHCKMAELAAILCSCGKMECFSGDSKLKIQTENEAVARKCFTLLQKTFNIETKIFVRENSHLKRVKVYTIEITDPEEIQVIFQALRLVTNSIDQGTLVLSDMLVVQQNCCKRAFIRGAFLASGSISDPEKGYHFEIVCSDAKRAEQLQTIIRSFSVDAKIVQRKKSHVVYVKEGAQIVDMLAVMEANVALMDLENIRILKEMRNSVNRKVNCETANINKTVNAAVKQMEDIKLVRQKIGFEQLNEGLAQVAELRMQYPEATLKESRRRIIMIKKPITINLSTGLEARPVAQLVQVASQFNSEIYVEIGKKRVNAKSIMGMMTLGLDAGEEITLSANGEDEEAAMAGIEQYLSNQ